MVCASQCQLVLPTACPRALGKTNGSPGRQQGMSTHHVEIARSCTGHGPSADVTTWRRCRLLEAGFPASLAQALASADVDVHALLQLVDRGCDPLLAARILSPLDVDLGQ